MPCYLPARCLGLYSDVWMSRSNQASGVLSFAGNPKIVQEWGHGIQNQRWPRSFRDSARQTGETAPMMSHHANAPLFPPPAPTLGFSKPGTPVSILLFPSLAAKGGRGPTSDGTLRLRSGKWVSEVLNCGGGSVDITQVRTSPPSPGPNGRPEEKFRRRQDWGALCGDVSLPFAAEERWQISMCLSFPTGLEPGTGTRISPPVYMREPPIRKCASRSAPRMVRRSLAMPASPPRLRLRFIHRPGRPTRIHARRHSKRSSSSPDDPPSDPASGVDPPSSERYTAVIVSD